MNLSLNFLWAFVGGLVPALLWLWFWTREDKTNPEPKRKIAVAFVCGMLAVLLVLPIEKLIYEAFGGAVGTLTIISWAFAEELLKFGAAYISSIFRNKYNDEPIDSLIYLITAALGFSALENAFFLVNFIDSNLVAQSIISGNMRFIGATLLHTASSATIGVFMAFGFYKNRERKKNFLFTGLLLATLLHVIFNSIIIKFDDNIFLTFAGVWVAIVLLLFIFEKIKTIRN